MINVFVDYLAWLCKIIDNEAKTDFCQIGQYFIGYTLEYISIPTPTLSFAEYSSSAIFPVSMPVSVSFSLSHSLSFFKGLLALSLVYQ